MVRAQGPRAQEPRPRDQGPRDQGPKFKFLMRARWRLPSAAFQNGRLTRSANKNMPRIGQHYRPNNSATKKRPTKCVQRKSNQKHRPNISAKTVGLKLWPNNSAQHFGQTFGLPPSTHRKLTTRVHELMPTRTVRNCNNVNRIKNLKIDVLYENTILWIVFVGYSY